MAPGSPHSPFVFALEPTCSTLLTPRVGEDGQSFDNYPQLPGSRDWVPLCIQGFALRMPPEADFPHNEVISYPRDERVCSRVPCSKRFHSVYERGWSGMFIHLLFHSLPSSFRSERKRRAQGNIFSRIISRGREWKSVGCPPRACLPG